jgi:ATP/maltotriose-dependent transcriptional regulator MalT
MSAEELLEAPNPTPGLDLHDKERRYLLGEINGLRSQALYFLGDFEQGLAFAEKSLEQLQESFSYGQSGAVLYWALHCHVLGRGKEAVDRLHQVIRAEPEDSPFTMHLHNGLCYIYRSLADFPRLSLAAHDYLRAAQKANLPESVAFAHYQLGVLHYEWNELELAQYHFGEATSLRYFAHELSYQSSLQGLTLVYLALGLNDRARETIAATHEFADQTGSDLLRASSCSFQARLSLFEGNLEKADRESLSVQGGSQLETMLLFEIPALTRAKVLYARATPESLRQAMTLLDKLFAQAKKNHFAWRQVEILALQGMILAVQNHMVEALSHLEQSVLLARPGWLIRTFVDLGSPLDDLLRQLAERGIAPEYLTHVLAAFDSEVKKSSPDHGSSVTSFEPLTERELEVLALINQRLTNQEIAQRLVISPKTVKRHASNIYEKLGVGNRRQAVLTARDLQILPPSKAKS